MIVLAQVKRIYRFKNVYANITHYAVTQALLALPFVAPRSPIEWSPIYRPSCYGSLECVKYAQASCHTRPHVSTRNPNNSGGRNAGTEVVLSEKNQLATE